MISIAQACNLVIFGTKGDLARRKLLPSLYHLEKLGYIHPDTKIIGISRAKWNVNAYIDLVRQALETFLKEPIDEKLWSIFSARLSFCNLDVNNASNFCVLAEQLKLFNRVTINYLAMPPTTFSSIFQGLGNVELNQTPNRIVMEKPLGTSLASSLIINNQVSQYFHETQVYRIDHYLGKETVLNLLALRFANYLFFTNWDNRTIDHIQITVAEEVGIEGRWDYFDQVGQLRDMIQSHLLQILTIIAMSPPSNLTTDSIHNEKVKVLRSLRPINHHNINDTTVRGQYTAGVINGRKVPGYLEEHSANKSSNTETFISIRVNIDNKQWTGVPFYLRTGKRLPMKCSEVVVYFKTPPINLFQDSYHQLPSNKLIIRLQPDEGIEIQILNKIPSLDHKYCLQTTKLDLSFTKIFNQIHLSDGYERLLLETMRGIQVLFVRRDEVEEAWKWVDSIIEAWQLSNDKPQLYKAGTWGPIASNELMTQDNRSWHELEDKNLL